MAAKYILSFICSMGISTVLIQKLLPMVHNPEDPERPVILPRQKIDFLSVGFWIGFFETLLIFMFVAQHEFGALAIIMAAKEFVRKEKVAENASYYLLGTLINLAVAVLFALMAGA